MLAVGTSLGLHTSQHLPRWQTTMDASKKLRTRAKTIACDWMVHANHVPNTAYRLSATNAVHAAVLRYAQYCRLSWKFSFTTIA
eukprot:4659876-Amphidinium_carterae.1